jgi:3-phosphoinositide dependent protein kinase-1
LTKDPSRRLGCGAKGSENDFEALKSHPFFEGIDWANLFNQKAPIEYVAYNAKPADPHSLSPSSEKNTCLSPVNDNDSLSGKEIIPFKISLISVEDTQNRLILECKYLLVTLLATVMKKSPWLHYNTRVLRLFSDGHINYLEPTSMTIKGTIKLDKTCQPVFNDKYNFDLITTTRKFIFEVFSIFLTF